MVTLVTKIVKDGGTKTKSKDFRSTDSTKTFTKDKGKSALYTGKVKKMELSSNISYDDLKVDLPMILCFNTGAFDERTGVGN